MTVHSNLCGWPINYTIICVSKGHVSSEEPQLALTEPRTGQAGDFPEVLEHFKHCVKPYYFFNYV